MRPPSPGLELWGGAQSSIVRIGDDHRDRADETGHPPGFADVAALANLGVDAIRYPLLWEDIAPDVANQPDFSGHSEQLDYLRKRNVTVLAGLVRRGSGPRYTNLLDPHFPRYLADYARRAARRYPWIKWWNPVDQPLTTARLSCLDGHGYPHGKSIDVTFRALVNQCLAIKRAKEAIRAVIPDARFMTSEDVGKTFATRPLQSQADQVNDRRWLPFDLLAGRVVPGHPLYLSLRVAIGNGDALAELADGSGFPDMIGFDHNPTSERFLDHRIQHYPAVSPASNGALAYVDLDAVRIPEVGDQLGPRLRLREIWKRYRLPIAITDLHHGCTRDEQLRWFHQAWTEAEAARCEGVDVRAVTLWSMAAMADRISPLDCRDGAHDAGRLDVRSRVPRPTLIAAVASQLRQGHRVDRPVTDLPGWWKRPRRTDADERTSSPKRRAPRPRPILITGAAGTLGRAFARVCAHRGLDHVLTAGAALDNAGESSIAHLLEALRPWAVIDGAGFVQTWETPETADECMAGDEYDPELLGQACHQVGIPLVAFSSDRVFDGKLGRPYVETDSPTPDCIHGHSKAECERRVLSRKDAALLVRTSAFFGPWDRFNFLVGTIEKLMRGEDVIASDRAIVSPTYVPDLVHATLDLLLDGERGIWHLANQGAISWHTLAREAAAAARLGGDAVRLVRDVEDGAPMDTSLSSGRGMLLRSLDQALGAFLAQSEAFRALP